jgi:hypothetical protein
MMTAKKQSPNYNYLSGYVPASYVPEISSSQIIAIPPYDDEGVSFKGYSKRLKGLNTYELFPQIRRSQGFIVPDATTFMTAQRSDKEKKFYTTSIHIDYLNSSGIPIYVILIDGALSTDKQRVSFTINNGNNHFDIDCKDSPRDFQTINYSILLSSALALGDYLQVTMYGWAE